MMEIKNQQMFTCGEGEQKKQIYFTIDLIPISVVFKYDFVMSESKFHNLATNTIDNHSIPTIPKMIKDIYRMDVYQSIIDLVCEKLNIEKRRVICKNENSIIKSFNFSIDESFYEFQYHGNFGRSYFIETKIHHALKYWEQFQDLGKRKSKSGFFLDDVDEIDKEFYCQFFDVKRYIDLQGVFNNRDHHYISQNTMDNFIKKLGKK
jgi:hypothetical protein